MVFGNTIKDQVVFGIDVATACENCIIVGHRVDDLGTGSGVNDLSGTSTTALNDETAF